MGIVLLYLTAALVVLVAVVAVRRAITGRSLVPLRVLAVCAASTGLLWLASWKWFAYVLGESELPSQILYASFVLTLGFAAALPFWSLRMEGRGWLHAAAIPVAVAVGYVLAEFLVLGLLYP